MALAYFSDANSLTAMIQKVGGGGVSLPKINNNVEKKTVEISEKCVEKEPMLKGPCPELMKVLSFSCV